MLWSIRYRSICWLLRLLVRCGLDELDLEKAVLRHQLKVLRRGGGRALFTALLRWPKSGRDGPIRLGRCHMTRASSGERVRKPRGGRYIGTKIVEAPAEVLDEGMAGDDDPRGTVSLQPSHGAKSSLQAPVVGLQRVVRMDLRVEGRREHLIQHTGVDPVSVGGDLDR